MPHAFRRESDLADALCRWLKRKGYSVQREAEQPGVGILDVLAVRKNVAWAIECKLSFGIPVLQQAARWKTPLRSVAIPYRGQGAALDPNRQAALYAAFRHFRVGVLEVEGNGKVCVVVEAPRI